jgi:hypothetical protein
VTGVQTCALPIYLQGEARQTPEGWVIEVYPNDPEGWRVTLVPRGGRLAVATTHTADLDPNDPPPFCGMGGAIDGDYLPVRPPLDVMR